jgi:Carboxypeptidase regulatory-like domain
MVFSGHAVSIQSVPDPTPPGTVGPGRNEVFFAVREDFKGNAGKEVIIRTNNQSSACGFDFETGKDYVVFANEINGQWWTSICSLTHELKSADDADLGWLRGISSLPPGATIFGRLTMRVSTRDTTGDTWHAAPMAGTVVTIAGPESRTATTDAGGNYRVAGLQPGTYQVSATAPDGYSAFDNPFGPWYNAAMNPAVVDRGCAEVDLSTQINGRIHGQVLLASGAPAQEVNVTLDRTPDEDRGDPKRMWHNRPAYATTKADGSFEFNRLDPGAYILGVNVTFAGNGAYYRKAVYPGPIVIRASQLIDDLKFELPEDSPAPSVPLRVQLVDRNGRGLEGTVILDDEMWDGSIALNPPQTDSSGVAMVILREGTRYEIHATANLANGRQMCAEPVEIVAQGELKPLTLVASHPGGNCRRIRK